MLFGGLAKGPPATCKPLMVSSPAPVTARMPSKECSTNLHDSRQSETPAWESRTLCTHQVTCILYSYNSSPPDASTDTETCTSLELPKDSEARLSVWRTPRERRAQVWLPLHFNFQTVKTNTGRHTHTHNTRTHTHTHTHTR